MNEADEIEDSGVQEDAPTDSGDEMESGDDSTDEDSSSEDDGESTEEYSENAMDSTHGDSTEEYSESDGDSTEEYSESAGDSTEEYSESAMDSTEAYSAAEEEEGGEDNQEEVSESSSSDEETERCPICLAKFRDQDLGAPESCDHTFCLQCIVEWSKNVNTCPVDRRVFNLIMARHCLEGVVYKRIEVSDHTLTLEDEVETDVTACEVCGHADNEDRMLLCDSCNLGYHLYCLTPAKERVPRGMWYCPVCAPSVAPQHELDHMLVSESEDDEVIHAPRSRRNRRYDDDMQIGRTLVRERVLRAITRIRGTTQVIDSDSASDWDPDMLSEGEATTSTSAAGRPRGTKRTRSPRSTSRKTPVKRKRRKTTRKTKKKSTTRKTKKKTTTRKTKKKTTRKRKTKTKRKSSTSTSKKTTGTKRKRKTRRRKGPKRKKKSLARTKRLMPKTVKTRIADKLGLKSPPVGRSMPTIKGRSERGILLQRGDIGAATLNVMGDRNEMLRFSDQSDEEVGGRQRVALAARPRVHRIGPNINIKHSCTAPAPLARISSAPAGFDLLGSIMQGQDILHTKPDDIKINRDGSLKKLSEAERNNNFFRRGNVRECLCEPQDGGDDKAGGDGGSHDDAGSRRVTWGRDDTLNTRGSTVAGSDGTSTTRGNNIGDNEDNSDTPGHTLPSVPTSHQAHKPERKKKKVPTATLR